MIRLSPALVLVVLGACNNDKDNPSTDVETDVVDTGVDTDTTTVPIEPPTWQVTGQVGNILAVHTLPSKGQDESYRVTAVFADALQGFSTAAGCLTRGGLCIQTLPTADDTFVDSDKEFDEDGRVYAWNGFSVTVDVVDAPFIIEDDGIHYYDFSVDGPPLEPNPVVSFAGEWGAFSSTSALVIPALELIEPSASDNVDVTDGFGAVRWTPGGAGIPHIVLVADDFTRVYRLADDGEYELDWESLDLGNEIPDVYYARLSVTESDVNGNTLNVVGVTRQNFGVQVCDDFPTTNVPGDKGSGNLDDRPNYVSVGYHGLIYENALYDYKVGGTGVSATIDFVIYDINFQPLCTIQYDASSNTPTTAWTVDNGMPLWQGYEIDLQEGRGFSDCGNVDDAIFGNRDLRVFLEQFTWGFGIGQLSPVQELELEAQLGAQWAIIGPQLHGVYATMDGVTAQEIGFGRNFDLDGCYALGSPTVADELVPSGPDLPNSAYAGFGLYTYDIQP